MSLAVPSPLVLLLALALFLYILSGFLLLLYRQHRSPLRHLSGPASPSFLFGNLAEMHDQENTDLIADWEAAYGSTFVYKGFICGCRLMTTDPTAVAHILGHAYDYPKPDFIRDGLATMSAGHDGLLIVEGATHTRQVRRVPSLACPIWPTPPHPLPHLHHFSISCVFALGCWLMIFFPLSLPRYCTAQRRILVRLISKKISTS